MTSAHAALEIFFDGECLGPLVAITRGTPIATLLKRSDSWLARHRLRLTGRAGDVCAADRCALPAARAS